MGLVPGSVRSPGGGHGYALQYSCLENPMDRGAWQAMVHRVAKGWTQLKQLHTCMKVKVSVTQLCWILCDPSDCNLPGPSVCGILQTRILELPFPSPDLPNPGMEPGSPALQANSLLAEP